MNNPATETGSVENRCSCVDDRQLHRIGPLEVARRQIKVTESSSLLPTSSEGPLQEHAMKNHVQIAVAIPALLGFGLALMTFNTGRLIAQFDPVRQLYDNPDEFQKLSGAAQSLLQLLYGQNTSAISELFKPVFSNIDG